MAVTRPAGDVREDVWIPTACDMCYNACSIRVHRVDGVAVKIEGIPEAAPNYGRVCAKGNAGLMSVYSPHRVKAPMVRTNPVKGIGVDPGWREVSWDEAMDLLVQKLRAARDRDPRSIAALSFDRNSFHVLRAFLAAVGSPNITMGSAGFFCGNGAHPVAYTLTGSNDVHPDLHHCDFLLMFGTSYGFVAQMNAMGITREMADARLRGMKLVVVDPVLSNAAAKADEWVPIRPGTDAAFALGLMREWVVELDRYDREFLRRYTNGTYLIGSDGRYVRDPASGKPLVALAETGETVPFDTAPAAAMALEGAFEVGGRMTRPAFTLFREHLRPYTPERVEEITSVPAATTRRIAREMVDAAKIGQAIEIDGQTLPLRPAAACWYRGISAHRHAMLSGMAMGQLDILLGAVDVPGGILNAAGAGPDWMPASEEDGLLVPGNPYGGHMSGGLPRRKVRQPDTLDLMELFPVSVYARAMMWLGQLRTEEFGLGYKGEVLLTARSNIMATSGDPDVVAKSLRSFSFICSMNPFHDETTEFADLLLPDAHSLERLVPAVYHPYYHYAHAAMPFERYAWNFQQPVVRAVPEARYWGEVLVDVAGRLGVLPDFNTTFNAAARLTGEHRLERDGVYSWEEIADRWAKSLCGDEHGVDYFREHGYYRSELVRGVKATYPRAFHDLRIAIYLEHFLDAGEAVRAFVEPRGIEWDTTDYVPLTDWKPCLRDEDAPPGYDLWVVNQKLPYMSYSHTAENPWLVGLSERNGGVYTIGINAATARAKGIADGDLIRLETPEGKRAEGVARLTEGIHPECLAVPGVGGRWVVGHDGARGRGVHFNSLLSYSFERMDTVGCALDQCVRVRVTRVAPVRA